MTRSLPASWCFGAVSLKHTQAHNTFAVLTPRASQPLTTLTASKAGACMPRVLLANCSQIPGREALRLLGRGAGVPGAGASILSAAGKGFSPATGPGPDSKWSRSAGEGWAQSPTLGAVTFFSLLPLRGQAEEGSSAQAGFPPSHPNGDATKGVGGAPEPVPEATPGLKWRGRREGPAREVPGQLLPPPAPPSVVGSRRRNSNWGTAAGQSCRIGLFVRRG